MSLRTHLVQLLSDREFVSGTQLGSVLGISRAAIHKHIVKLRSSGLPIDCVRGRGYKLVRGIIPLNANSIIEHLDKSVRVRLNDLHIEQCVDSTNNYLQRLPDAKLLHGAVCLAETQSAGRGRRGNPWIASPYRNLMMSMGWVYDSWPKAISGLAIAVGMELVEVLAGFGANGLSIKWPNDIVYGQKKLGGILIDASGESAGPCSIIIGVGLNVQLAETDGAHIDQPWADLMHDLGCTVDRNQLAADCAAQLYKLLQNYDEIGFAPYQARWGKIDVLSGRKVSVKFKDGGQRLVGRALGVDSLGGLRVRQAGAKETVCYHGDVSVRWQ